MRRTIALLGFALVPGIASAQGATKAGGQVTVGTQQVENNTNSSKFSEYRDLQYDRVPLALQFSGLDSAGRFVRLFGTDLGRKDQEFGLSIGMPRGFRLTGSWNDQPHNLSNKAVTPYVETRPGVLDLPGTMAITFKKLATAAADAPNVVRMDTIASAFVRSMAKPTDLENIIRTGAVELRFNGIQALDLSVGYRHRARSGNRIGYGPIGDRPPRTLNFQFAQPIKDATGDLTFAAEYVRPLFQVRGEYLVSQYENEIDVLQWRNAWASAPAGATFDTWDRTVAVWGRRSLDPDNRYQNARLSGGIALPFDSRLTVSAARGSMKNDITLLPYAYQMDVVADKTLPRSTADALVYTTNYTADYFIAPLQRLNVRAFFRYFDYDNQTESSKWRYVTQDATNLNGTVAYVNKRKNEPFAWARQNLGIETVIRLPVMHSSLTLGAEREQMDREHRQVAEMSENIIRAGFRARPVRWAAIRANVSRGMREAEEYDWRSPSESYWYEATDNPNNNDPKNSFEDHPDMRKFDMANRQRDRADFTLTLTPIRNLVFSTGLRYRKDDFDSDVVPIAPLENLPVADRAALTPGQQLGLLNSESRRVNFDVTWTPTERLGLNASYGIDAIKSDMKSIEFNENNKKNPSAINTAMLGPWTRAGSIWSADFDDQTRYAAVGGSYEILPGKLTATANYTGSLANLALGYAGFGLVSFDGVTPLPTSHEFAFQPPPDVKQRTHSANFAFELPFGKNIGGRLGWQFESYSLSDWQQGTGTTGFETVGTDLLLRDTSRSHQWGNRLLNMGPYLAPGFTGHSVFIGLNYRFGR